jgi:hypothetical protein
MTANPEETEPLANYRELDLSDVRQLDIAGSDDNLLRVVAADTAFVADRPNLSLDSSCLPLPASSNDVSALSGSLDLSNAPAGLEPPSPDVSFFLQEPNVDISVDAEDSQSVGNLGSARFETEPSPLGLESQPEGKTDGCDATPVGPACIESDSLDNQGPSSVEMRRTGFDSHLARTIDAWPSLPLHVRETIVTIINATLNG